MHNVQDIFGDQFLIGPTSGCPQSCDCKHKHEIPIKDHMLAVIRYLVESRGSKIDDDTKMEMIRTTRCY